jgi:serine protease Do
MMKISLWISVLLLTLTAPVQARDLPDFTELVEKQGPAVVNISSSQVTRDDGDDGRMPGMPQNHPQIPRGHEGRSLGSGFIISADGYILTNAHVVEDAEEVTVRLTDKQEFKAKVIGSDKRTDVALLKINATGLPRVAAGDPGRLKVGEWVAAIGSPFGFDNSVTAGIVSAKGRSLPQENYVPFIQTDVAINPGNSGGPLFNLKGEVVGINSQIFSRTGGFMGLSFAIPIDVAMEVSDQLRATGKVSRGWLGVSIQEVSRELAETFALSKPTGALIAAVEPGSPAEKAGLQPSDVVLKFDGKTVHSSSELPRLVGPTKPGAKVVVQVWRRGAAKDVNVVVGELPADKVAEAAAKQGGSANKLGLLLSDLTAQLKRQLKIAGGALVEEVSGIAARAGIRSGDVILAFNNQEVKSAEQFGQLLAQAGAGRNVALLVRRGDSALYIPLRIGK